MEARADAAELAGLLRASVARALSGIDRAALMFSGGLDSSVLAVLARKGADIVAYVSGIEGSHDLEWARRCAAILDIELAEIVFTEDDVAAALEDVVRVHGMLEPGWMSTFVAHDLAFHGMRERVVLTGMGADEAFGGYAKYLRAEDPAARMAVDLESLLARERPAYSAMAADHGKSLLTPYLEPDVLRMAAGIPIERKLGVDGNKLVLREAAEILGVPGMMAWKPKKAMQYGSGVSKALKRHIAGRGMDLRLLIDSIHA